MRLLCSACRSEAQMDAPCVRCGHRMILSGGIMRAIAPDRQAYFEKFLCEYMTVRRAEGRGSSDPAYYRALPFHDGPWKIRATTYKYLESRLLPSRALDILDLGAGNGWLSNRLAQRGHRPVAVDVFADGMDGLGAARHYGMSFPLIEAEFDRLPFEDRQFDWAVFNCSLHYSTDYRRTLAEALRCLRPDGQIVVLDSPVYKRREHGDIMREERHRYFERTYGFRSDSIPSVEFLWHGLLRELENELSIRWRIHRPWYGWAWQMRPWKARLARRRPPSRFWILVGSPQR